MSRVKNVSGGPLDVPLLNGRVETDAVVDVPDFQPGHNPKAAEGDGDWLPIIWPADKWQPVAEPKKRGAKTSASDDGSDA